MILNDLSEYLKVIILLTAIGSAVGTVIFALLRIQLDKLYVRKDSCQLMRAGEEKDIGYVKQSLKEIKQDLVDLKKYILDLKGGK